MLQRFERVLKPGSGCTCVTFSIADYTERCIVDYIERSHSGLEYIAHLCSVFNVIASPRRCLSTDAQHGVAALGLDLILVDQLVRLPAGLAAL